MPIGRSIVMASLLLGALADAPPTRAEDGWQSPALSAPAPTPSQSPQTSFDVALSPVSRAAEIPWAQLSEEAYARVRDVVAGAVLSHETRGISFRSRKAVFDYLLDHPDFAADVARALRQGKYKLQRVGDGYDLDDGYGAHGTLTPVFTDEGRRLYHLAGRVKSGVLPAIVGQLVILLESEHLDGPDGITYCEMRVAGHLRIDSAGGELIGALAQRLGSGELDKKITRLFRHVAVLSRRAYDDPVGLADDLSERPGLAPERLAELRALLLAGVPPGWSETQEFRLLDDPALSGGS